MKRVSRMVRWMVAAILAAGVVAGGVAEDRREPAAVDRNPRDLARTAPSGTQGKPAPRHVAQAERSPRIPLSSRQLPAIRGREEEGRLQDVVWTAPIFTGKSVAFSPDGQLLATTLGWGQIGLFRVADGSRMLLLTGHTETVHSVAFSPDGQLLASGGRDGVAVWQVHPESNTPPSAPILLAPADGTTITDSPFPLQLSATDPDLQQLQFRVELWRDGQIAYTFDQRGEPLGWDRPFYAGGQTATLTPPFVAAGTYQWRVQAFDGKEWSPFSETRTFTLDYSLHLGFY